MCIRTAGTEVDDLRASIPIALQGNTFRAVVGVRDSVGTADDASTGIGSD
jgi:hypothetical protein